MDSILDEEIIEIGKKYDEKMAELKSILDKASKYPITNKTRINNIQEIINEAERLKNSSNKRSEKLNNYTKAVENLTKGCDSYKTVIDEVNNNVDGIKSLIDSMITYSNNEKLEESAKTYNSVAVAESSNLNSYISDLESILYVEDKPADELNNELVSKTDLFSTLKSNVSGEKNRLKKEIQDTIDYASWESLVASGSWRTDSLNYKDKIEERLKKHLNEFKTLGELHNANADAKYLKDRLKTEKTNIINARNDVRNKMFELKKSLTNRSWNWQFVNSVCYSGYSHSWYSHDDIRNINESSQEAYDNAINYFNKLNNVFSNQNGNYSGFSLHTDSDFNYVYSRLDDYLTNWEHNSGGWWYSFWEKKNPSCSSYYNTLIQEGEKKKPVF